MSIEKIINGPYDDGVKITLTDGWVRASEKHDRYWIDDIRSAPEGYIWITSVNDFKSMFESKYQEEVDMDVLYNRKSIYSFDLDLDHDAGDFQKDGGDYIEILKFLEEFLNTEVDEDHSKFIIQVRIHSMNPVGRKNMHEIIAKNGWMEY